MSNARNLAWALAFFLLTAATGCDKSAKNAPAGANANKTAAPRPAENFTKGYDSPEKVMDAYVQAMKQENVAAYKALLPKQEASDFDALVKMQEENVPADQKGKISLRGIRNTYGLDDEHKRFPAEVSGDKASILTLFLDPNDPDNDSYARYEFAKTAGGWQLASESFVQSAKEIDRTKYPWRKGLPGEQIAQPMLDLMAKLDNKPDTTEKLFKQYAAEGAKLPFGFVGLRNPRVIRKEVKGKQELYTLRAAGGSILQDYLVAWENGKIVSVEEKRK